VRVQNRTGPLPPEESSSASEADDLPHITFTSKPVTKSRRSSYGGRSFNVPKTPLSEDDTSDSDMSLPGGDEDVTLRLASLPGTGRGAGDARPSCVPWAHGGDAASVDDAGSNTDGGSSSHETDTDTASMTDGGDADVESFADDASCRRTPSTCSWASRESSFASLMSVNSRPE
jgi:hypothetical protein